LLGAVGVLEGGAPVVRDRGRLPPLLVVFVGLGGAEEGVVGAVDVAGGGLGEGERVLGGGGEPLVAGEQFGCFAGPGERLVAVPEPGECWVETQRAIACG
jgi:hypothetical protein